MTPTSKSTGKQLRIYLRREAALALQAEADYIGIRIEDLVKKRAVNPELDEIQTQLKNLAERNQHLETNVLKLTEQTQHLELILLRLCTLIESGLIDTAYVRGAIEVQAAQSKEAVKRAEEIEKRRLQMAQKIREEIGRYL